VRRIFCLLAPALAFAALPGAAHALVHKEATHPEAAQQEAAPAGPALQIADLEIEESVEVEEGASASRFFVPDLGAAEEAAIASYGPFRVLDERTAALVDATDEVSPDDFAAMLRDFPEIAALEFHDCPGTYDDIANLRLGRLIRAAGLETRVPEGGSVRSGAVELFLAGATRVIADGAEFAVHAWLDEDGLEPGDFSATSPENRKYLSYYRDMGMSPQEADAFYAMTNSASFDNALWLTGSEMRRWVSARQPAEPKLAYLDLAAGLN